MWKWIKRQFGFVNDYKPIHTFEREGLKLVLLQNSLGKRKFMTISSEGDKYNSHRGRILQEFKIGGRLWVSSNIVLLTLDPFEIKR